MTEEKQTHASWDGHIDTVIGVPSNLFYSTGIPVCILVKIIETYQFRKEEPRHSRRVAMEEIEKRLQPEHLTLRQHGCG